MPTGSQRTDADREGSRQGGSQRISRSALVPYSASDMFALVTDVESYPRFLPWCRGAEVHVASSAGMRASVEFSKGPVRICFTTENHLQAPERIDMRLVKGPFSRLHGAWRFVQIGDEGCRVSLDMDFELEGRVLRAALSALFREIAGALVDAFCRRAHQLYGPALRD